MISRVNEGADRAADSLPRAQPERKPYRAPVLRTYGLVTEITRQFGPGPLSDSGNNRMGMGLSL
jgi:hypothetical protein